MRKRVGIMEWRSDGVMGAILFNNPEIQKSNAPRLFS
jgi:hypothetical protein